MLPQYVVIDYFLCSPIICHWTFGLFPPSGCGAWSCCEHGRTKRLLESLPSVLLRMYLEVKFLERAVNSVFHSLGNQNCCPQTRLFTPFHTPTSHARGFHAPTSCAQGFHVPTSLAQRFRAPTAHAQGFRTPTSRAQRFRVPTSCAQGFRAPTSHAQGFHAPTSRVQGFRAPTARAQGFRAPTSRAQGFCAPTSWTQGFRFLHVLASTC